MHVLETEEAFLYCCIILPSIESSAGMRKNFLWKTLLYAADNTGAVCNCDLFLFIYAICADTFYGRYSPDNGISYNLKRKVHKIKGFMLRLFNQLSQLTSEPTLIKWHGGGLLAVRKRRQCWLFQQHPAAFIYSP